MIPTKFLSCRISLNDIVRKDVPRLVEAVGYLYAMRRARVPEKNIRRIMRRWTSPFRYAIRKEMRALVVDLQRGVP